MTGAGTEQLARRKAHLPGVEGVWAFVFADLTMFGIMFAAFMVDRREQPDLFETSRQALSINFGGLNTLILLTSSMLVALAVEMLKSGRSRSAPLCFSLALACGLAFMASKAFEYKEKFDAGITMLSNDFFMYYFVLTGIHLVHVLAGNVVLAVLWLKSRAARSGVLGLRLYESGAT